MVEIFTVGGGDYLVNVFQAVAAWTGNGGYKSLLQVVLVMGLGLSAISLAFNQDWRAWINWFLGATLIYSCLMVPRLDVHVTDRLNPSLAPANVSNVPLGLALMASFTSRLSTMASQARSNSESYANIATESTTSAVTKFRELRSQFSRGSAFESATGTSNSDSIQTAFNEVDQASTNLQRQFGLSRRAADDISTAWFLGGEAGANVPQADPGTIHDEVLRAHDAGRQRIRGTRSRLDTVTRGAQGASAESADEVKEW
jgi:hypothetical protein